MTATDHLKRLQVGVVLALIGANLFVWHVVFREDRRGVLTVAFLDVGQGDAIFIEAPNGNQVLLDGGPGKRVLRELGRVMPFYDRSLDLLIASHSDADHIAGLIDVLDRFEVAGFLESGSGSPSAVYRTLKGRIVQKGVRELRGRRGMKVVLAPAVSLTILFPDRDPEGMPANDASLVARLVYGETEFLLTGDAPAKIERYLVRSAGGDLRSDVLKVGHHGSKTSSEPEFIASVRPRYGVVSSGQNNRYGHPHPEVIRILQEFGVEILRTDELGTVTIKSDGEQLFLPPRRGMI